MNIFNVKVQFWSIYFLSFPISVTFKKNLYHTLYIYDILLFYSCKIRKRKENIKKMREGDGETNLLRLMHFQRNSSL